MNPQPAKNAAARAFNAFNLATFIVGTKSGNTINVGVQLRDAHGNIIFDNTHCKVYLSDSADGSTLTPTATSSALAIGTLGTLLDITTTGKVCSVLSNATGFFDLNIIQSVGGTNYYLAVVLPDGNIIASPVLAY